MTISSDLRIAKDGGLRLLRGVLLCLLVATLSACGESHSWRQKTIIEVETPHGLVSGGNSSASAIIASLAAFRGVYYVAPLVVGGALLTWSEFSAIVARWGSRGRSLAASHVRAKVRWACSAMAQCLRSPTRSSSTATASGFPTRPSCARATAASTT